MLPALPYWITGSFDATIWCFRLCSLALLALGLGVLWRALHEKLGAGRFELWLGAGLVATSVKIVAFSANGQETGLLVGFLALALARAGIEGPDRLWLDLAAGPGGKAALLAGLVQGAGFAGVLGTSGLPLGEAPSAWLGFEIGLLVAQALVAALLLGLRLFLADPLARLPSARAAAILASGTLAAFWCLERVAPWVR